MGHGAAWLVCGDLPKCIGGRGVREGVKQRHTAIEAGLNLRLARDGKGNVPQF
jgi:hypothetical protein